MMMDAKVADRVVTAAMAAVTMKENGAREVVVAPRLTAAED